MFVSALGTPTDLDAPVGRLENDVSLWDRIDVITIAEGKSHYEHLESVSFKPDRGLCLTLRFEDDGTHDVLMFQGCNEAFQESGRIRPE